jgi:hypothetical protein
MQSRLNPHSARVCGLGTLRGAGGKAYMRLALGATYFTGFVAKFRSQFPGLGAVCSACETYANFCLDTCSLTQIRSIRTVVVLRFCSVVRR